MKLRLATLGLTWESARSISSRKSLWMVLWLRARREGDCLRGYYRSQHFREKRP
jgi:hypothetical protein